ncbi:MAG TPA: uroporphyrinogen-III C-methyltransferase [Chitinophagales bacterium]|nr:uroporphyrinogen-III C-methyltransferase [Chitinophagales bacterium]
MDWKPSNENHPKARLSLVGAGPGDPDLITYKAVKVLQNADVVLYDALVDKNLLQHAPHVEHIYVGKRAGDHNMTQLEINRLIVEVALKYGHVVRLKGGDPFIFGRGYEELAFAAEFHIPTTYIPGISSAIAVPGLAGIPLTNRGDNESFWVTTGTTSLGHLSADIALAAQSSATVVILMGMSKLSQIVQIFKNYRYEDLPIAVIQSGSTPKEKKVFGNLKNIEERVLQGQLSTPAIIVLGEVVAHSKSYSDYLELLFKSS